MWRRLPVDLNRPRRSSRRQRAPILRGEYGAYRVNNDLLSYHLDIRVSSEKKFISGKNTVRFKMLKDDARIQLDLYENLNVEKILFGGTTLKFEREANAVLVDSPDTLKQGREYSIDFHSTKDRGPGSSTKPCATAPGRSAVWSRRHGRAIPLLYGLLLFPGGGGGQVTLSKRRRR